jgi:2-dehydro-3-deoxyphosphogluconate aldolase/(4S)-4-hydroxy-2-oxoglutarate aldolase
VNSLQRLEQFRVVPVVVLDALGHADALADALVHGGLACAEVTLRTDASLDVIAAMSRRGDVLVGAGTVVSVEQVDRAIDAGAHFLVSPGFDRDVIEHAQSAGVPFIPGVATASEVLAAIRAGLDHVKFFPAIPAGGLPVISALHGPFATMRFMPTGGVTLATLNDFITHPAVFAVGGSWMVTKACLDAGDFATVERITRETVDQLHSLPS